MRNRIRVRLAELEMTQKGLAEKLNKDDAFISRVINNNVAVKLSTAFEIAKVLDCKVEDIFIYE